MDEEAAPRSAIGIKNDGTIIFYTIDGRQSGHSFGLRLKTLSKRLKELGCVDAINFDGGGSSEEVIVNFILNEDGTFEWKFAEDPYDNYVKGTYTFKDLNKINNGENARYVEIELNGEEFVIDGVVQEDIYKSKYEMALVTENEDGVINSKYDIYSILLINSDTYNMYYAER